MSICLQIKFRPAKKINLDWWRWRPCRDSTLFPLGINFEAKISTAVPLYADTHTVIAFTQISWAWKFCSLLRRPLWQFISIIFSTKTSTEGCYKKYVLKKWPAIKQLEWYEMSVSWNAQSLLQPCPHTLEDVCLSSKQSKTFQIFASILSVKLLINYFPLSLGSVLLQYIPGFVLALVCF